MQCGAEIGEGPVSAIEPAQQNPDAEDEFAADENVATEIAGWRIEARLPSASAVRERFLAINVEAGTRGVLTLYADGSEPDPSVFDAIRNMPDDHLPRIYEVGRWHERAYEISEEISGGSLAEAKFDGSNLGVVNSIAFEVGKALGSFSQAGLRHRDITPANILIRTLDPMDLVVTGFGSARLSDYDLDIVAPLETTQYMAPEAIAGGVAAASDWWSLGMILLEIVTAGACFEGVNPQAFLIHVLTKGVTVPDGLDPSVERLLKGLLARDHRERWQWNELRAWYSGEVVPLPAEVVDEADTNGRSNITLAGRSYSQPSAYALAAAEPGHWDEARNQASRGVIAAWAEDAGFDDAVQSALRRLAHTEGLSDDLRLSMALKILYPSMPLIVKGNIVTPGWLLDHPVEGTDLIFGPSAEILARLGVEEWLQRMKQRGISVRAKARQFSIMLNEEDLQVHLLSSSKARLAALWTEKRRILPDTDHPGLNSLIERRQTTDEDFILLLSADVGQFRTVDEILNEAQATADRAGVRSFDRGQAQEFLGFSRRDLHALIDKRLAGFARSNVERIDEWADQFRLDRRITLDRTLVLLSIPENHWIEPPKQSYVSTLLEYFSKKISGSILRGPLTRMVIGTTTPRVDLTELGTERKPAAALLDLVLARTDRGEDLDPSAFGRSDTLERRLRSLYAHSTLYKRDTGIDGLYMGFPFLIHRDDRRKPKIAPILLWPVKVVPEVGNRGHATIAFDRDRDEVRLNPAFEGMIGIDASRRWQEAANDLLGRSTLTAADVVDGFGGLAKIEGRALTKLPGKDTEAEFGQDLISCSAVLFHLAYMGQAIVEDLRQLKSKQLSGSALETALKVTDEPPESGQRERPSEIDRFFTVASDPSQEAAVIEARHAPGLLIEGPPGTGKSQTIVNMVADAIGRKKSLLVICQKQAALEVVKKRLEAEGLEDRIFMVTDINRDREPIIQAIRDQLEAHHNNQSNQLWKRDRQNLATRIQAVENDLNGHHSALHQIDDHCGYSYRTLLGELIEIETPEPPLDVPSLRRLLGPLSPSQISELAEACGPQARYWLPAHYEGSALVALKTFNPDPANTAAFDGDLAEFIRSETERLDVFGRTAQALAMEDPEPYRKWLAENDHEFSALDKEEWTDLARWYRLCVTEKGSSKAITGETNLRRLNQAISNLKGTAPKDAFRAQTLTLSDAALDEWATDTNILVTPPSFLGKLNPFRWTRTRKTKSFLQSAGLPPAISAFDDALRWEKQLRPLRRELVDTLRPFGEENAVSDNLIAGDLAGVADQKATAIARAQSLVDRALSYPVPAQLEAVLAKASLVEYESLRSSAHQAFERYEAKQFSRASLENASQWFEPKWVSERLKTIEGDGANGAAIATIMAARMTLEAYQRFRIRANGLPQLALEIFKLLRPRGEDLARLQPNSLDEEVRKVIRREAMLAWKARLENDDPRLLYEAAELDAKIRSVGEAEKAMRRANRQMLTQGIDPARVASPREWEAITRLRGQRAQRLREFLEKGPDLGLMELRPVWLMNPDVASRVLPLRKNLFDTVIYDEASQMPVEYALPTLFRGEVVIISGDEKQMPPTAFFASRVENDEADVFDGNELDEDATETERETYNESWNRREIKDCPDLLQLGKSVLPTTTLQIHYRSAYRELIGFSNSSFYGNRLSVPVRHPDDEILRAKPVEVIRADGIYADQTNEIEARRVVAVLGEIWRKPGKTPTVGVVTFNRKQADLIEEILEKEAERDDWFRNMVARERDRVEKGEDVGFFVKNVENVQGDERDYIIFSSTFGKNAQGSFRRNFGVLGQKGGERRLNVAVTRARIKVIMVTSMPIGDVSDMLSSRRKPSIPRDYLQGYLEYARSISDGDFANGRTLLDRMLTERSSTHNRDESSLDGFSASVATYLDELGVSYNRANDGSAFSLDFAIEDPQTGLYGLGIECDAPRHRILDSARAREIWRPSVLGRSIPVVHRISSHGWYHSRDEEKQRLRDAVNAAIYREAAE
ncbi:histidine kinase [Rhizobium sp. L9]|uniref:protein kinase domain-containing protein n=1 Tax=Rhizobium sp. L9 TaxID=1340738 RepID=UPI000BE955A1|nr:AAA domain-containing protein [Rhizobium sp. L9]PDT32288.1 histidine kinase [Rhizobium sp. L9]